MERLTEKITKHNCYEIKDNCNQTIYDKLGKLEDLEEEIGCPLEIFLKLALKKIDTIFVEYDDGWDNEFNAIVSSIYDDSKDYQEPNWVIETNITTFKVKDYKKTWWLKKDRSE